MTTNEIRRLYQTRPFRPFTICLADGRALQVSHPENITFSTGGRTIHIYESESVEIVDLFLVISLGLGKRPGGKASNN